MPHITLGTLLRQHRLQADLSQKALAALINYDHSSISRFERDERLPPPGYLAQFATALALSEPDRETLLDLYRANPDSPGPSEFDPSPPHRESWGAAPDVSRFYGRQTELQTLHTWLLDDRCRLISVLAMGGTGKTMLATQLAVQTAPQFDYVVWRTLRNAPALAELLLDLIQILSDHQAVLPTTEVDHLAPQALSQFLGQCLTQLLGLLQKHRCLIVLDNIETILHETNAGDYQPGYETYRRFLQQIGQSDHRSSLILTSREKPGEIGPLESPDGPVRTLSLQGLDLGAANHLLTDRGLSGTVTGCQRLIQHYSGNPLALTLVSELVREVYGGDVDEFLAEDELIFDQISDVIDEQFERLSPLEQSLMFWLAVEREPVSRQTLRQNLMQAIPARRMMEALRSLRRRALIEQNEVGFTLQNVIMEYVTDRLVGLVCQEIRQGQAIILHSQALLKAQTQAYVHDSQRRLILQPIIDNLTLSQPSGDLTSQVADLLDTLRRQTVPPTSYAAGNLLNLCRQLSPTLTGLDVSHLPVRQADLRGVALHDTNFSHAHFLETHFFETFGLILSVAYSPDGGLLAAGTANGEIRLWNLTTNEQLPALVGHTDWVKCLAFSPDSTMLLSGSVDQTLRWWELATSRCHYTLKSSASITDVVISPDGSKAVSSSLDGTLHVWDLATGQESAVIAGDTPLRSLALSPDGQTLASGDKTGRIQLWDFTTRQPIATLSGHTRSVRALCFSPTGETLVSGSSDQTLRVWEMKTRTCRHTLIGHSQRVLAVSVTADGTRLVSSSDDQTIRVWNAETGHPLDTLRGHKDWVRAVACHPTHDTIASGSDDQTLRFWDLPKGRRLKTLQGYTNIIWSVAVSPDGATIASGSDDRTVRLWAAETGQLRQTLTGHTTRVWAITFSPDGQTLASSSYDQTIRVWDLSTGTTRHILQGHTGQIWAVAFSPDGRRIASGGDDATICLWDSATGACQTILTGHTAAVRQTLYSPDGVLFSCGEDGTIRRWDVSQATCVQTMTGHRRWIRALAVSPDGRIIASGSDDQTIRLWDTKRGDLLQTLTEQSGRIEALAFSPDGQILASGGSDQLIGLWQVASGQRLKTLAGHQDRIRALVFDPTQPHCLLSSSQDETIKIWDVGQAVCQQTLHPDRPYERMNLSQATGLNTVQRLTLKRLGAIETT